MRTLTVFLLLGLLGTPHVALCKDAPSRQAEKGCKWEQINDAALGLEVWVQQCDFGFRKVTLSARANALAQHFSDGGEDEKLIETFPMQAGEKPEAAIKRVFDQHTTDQDLVARCLVKPYKSEGPVPQGVKRYTVLPNAALAKEWKAKTDPGDIPEPPCGEWGDMPDSVQYYEVQAGANRIMIVRAGQDEPMFDDRTLRLLPLK